MAVWHYDKIREECLVNNLIVPLNEEQLNPNTYDLTISGFVMRENPFWRKWAHRPWWSKLWDGRKKVDPPWDEPLWGPLEEVSDWIVFQPGECILAATLETISIPPDARGVLYLKSSLGRENIEHLHAGLFDAGFRGTGTLELVNVSRWRPARIKVGRRCFQMEFMNLLGLPLKHYGQTGRYQDQVMPTASRA